ncbi:MAG: methyltransferase domain-containing protein [Nanoarchaeota archaeon]|nr:methyltransferase domain-containing protein [Nanoarchaeota archaeon]
MITSELFLSDIKMFNVPESKTKNRHESTWDHHGSYQWTYFADEIKQRINFFLLQRLRGNNIEVGGGWYLSYPDSVVVDLSTVCLNHNPAKEKLQFDLDIIGKGKKLPYKDNSFNSATLISVWQYLQHPKAVLGELERILKPGAEIYLINGQGAGLQECVVGRSRTEYLQEFFQELGYDTLVEHIPAFNGSVSEFQSVCVAMPDVDLFGDAPSRIKNKAQRKKQDQEICQDSSKFINAYVDWEMRNITARLAKLSSFPVTRYSQEYLGKIEAFSQKYHEQTGGIPLIFMEHSFEPELAMLTQDYKFLYETMFLMGVTEKVDNYSETADEMLKKYELGFTRYSNYFNQPTTTNLVEYCAEFEPKQEYYWSGTKGNETELRKFATFISSLGLNSFTRKLQKQVYDRLQPNVPDLDEQIQRQRAFGYKMATYEHKQKRNIDELIAIKKRIEEDGVPTVETRKLDYFPILPVLRQFIK